MKRTIFENIAVADFDSHRRHLEYCVTRTNISNLWPLALLSCFICCYGGVLIPLVILAGTTLAWINGLGIVIVEDALSEPRQPRYWLIAHGKRSEIPYEQVEWCQKQVGMVSLTNE